MGDSWLYESFALFACLTTHQIFSLSFKLILTLSHLFLLNTKHQTPNTKRNNQHTKTPPGGRRQPVDVERRRRVARSVRVLPRRAVGHLSPLLFHAAGRTLRAHVQRGPVQIAPHQVCPSEGDNSSIIAPNICKSFERASRFDYHADLFAALS